MCERELETEQNCNILTPILFAITAFLSRSPGLINRGLGAHSAGCCFSLLHLISNSTAQSGAWGSTLLGAGFLYRILSQTDWNSCAPSYIIVQSPPSSCGRHKSHSFNPSTVKVIFWYSSTGCTCYLHRCISYFDSPARSEANIQQNVGIILFQWEHLLGRDFYGCHRQKEMTGFFKKLFWKLPYPAEAMEQRRRHFSRHVIFCRMCCFLNHAVPYS